MNTTGTIFEIQHLASFDGPGIRTVVYLKGCPLHCLWCHNPEGLLLQTQIFYNPERCIACGHCVDVCTEHCHKIHEHQHQFARDHCRCCGACASGCFPHAIEQTGKTVTVQTILEEVSIDMPFFQNTGGGLTLSGGEPLMQPEFAFSLLSHAKDRGIHTCVETSGFCDKKILAKIASMTDLFLFDIKESDPDLHLDFTGVSNQRILENLKYLQHIHNHIILRCPMIPDLNMRTDHFIAIAKLAQHSSSVKAIELLPYHPIGLAKYSALAQTPLYTNPHFLEKDSLYHAIELMRQFTNKPIMFPGSNHPSAE